MVDTNGDGAFLACVVLHLDDDAVWRESAWDSAAVLGGGWAHGVAYAYGRAPDAVSVDVGFRGALHQVPVTDRGWWLFLIGAEQEELPDLGRVPAPLPVGRRRRPRDQRPPHIAG